MPSLTETDIWERLVSPEQGDMAPELAEYVLRLGFSDADQDRLAELSRKANEGTLDAAERRELESFIRVGHVLAMLQSKARLSLGGKSFAA